MLAALCSFSRRAPRACNAALDALSGPSLAAVPSASTQACATWAGVTSHQWPTHSAAEAALRTRLCSTLSAGGGASVDAGEANTAGLHLPDSSAAWHALRQRSDAVDGYLQPSVWQPAAGGASESRGHRTAHRQGGNEQQRRMATARGSAVPLQTARVEHAPIGLEGHIDAPIPRPAPAGRHAEHPFPVKAFYIGSKLDVEALRNRARAEQFPAALQKGDSTIMCVRPGFEISESEDVTGLPMETYLMAFTYGSVVMFNASEGMQKRLLRMCRKYAKNMASEDYSEELMIHIQPDMEAWSKHSPEAITLQRLDWSNLRVVAAVLGQSVALDYYARSVESMLETFCDMNLEMARTGNFSTQIGKEQLLRLVAHNNVILTDIITKLGLLDYHELAWKTSQYGRIWEYLRRDFDVEARFEAIEDKLKLVQENLKYFLEIMQHKKSDALEWTIIILIAAEIFVSLFDMYTKVGSG